MLPPNIPPKAPPEVGSKESPVVTSVRVLLACARATAELLFDSITALVRSGEYAIPLESQEDGESFFSLRILVILTVIPFSF